MEAHKMEPDCLKEQEELIPLEQAARQKVMDLFALMKSEMSQGSVLEEIMRAKRRNEIQGDYGRMRDLGITDAKYDVAISTACVQLLCKKDLGVATNDVGVSRLFDLIKVQDETMKLAFFATMGNIAEVKILNSLLI